MKLFKKTVAGTLVVVGVASSTLGQRLDRYEDPPKKHAYETILEKADTPFEKHLFKAQQMAKVDFKEKGFSMEGISVEVFHHDRINDLVRVSVKATKDGKALTVNNPLLYKNPPIKVPTGKFHKQIIEGIEVDVPNTRVDPKEALKQIIIQTIKLQNGL